MFQQFVFPLMWTFHTTSIVIDFRIVCPLECMFILFQTIAEQTSWPYRTFISTGCVRERETGRANIRRLIDCSNFVTKSFLSSWIYSVFSANFFGKSHKQSRKCSDHKSALEWPSNWTIYFAFNAQPLLILSSHLCK